MEPALKQRLIGAAVLLALAVIFLPMLIKGPAPESGVSDVSLDMPDSPRGEYETRELPLVTPGSAPRGGALGMDPPAGDARQLPTVDTTDRDAASAAGDDGDMGMMPPPTAGGDYAVSFGSYASFTDAQRVVDALTSSQLPGYQESVPASDGRTLYRVRIGPYASQAEAEAARLRAAHVRDDVGSRVVVLDGQAPVAASPDSGAAAASSPAPGPSAAQVADKPADTPEASKAPKAPEPAKPARPAATAAAPAPVPATEPAAADVGFAVQLGAFSVAAEAEKLRERAQAAGFNVFVEQVRTDQGTLSRVRVGPVVERAQAERLKAEVAAKLGINGFVQSHP